MDYHICKIKKGDFRIVPSTWLAADNKTCLWPPLDDVEKINNLIQDCQEPSYEEDDEWIITKIRKILISKSNYQQAKETLNIIEMTSDMDTDVDEDKLKKTRSSRHKKRLRESDNDEISDESQKKRTASVPKNRIQHAELPKSTSFTSAQRCINSKIRSNSCASTSNNTQTSEIVNIANIDNISPTDSSETSNITLMLQKLIDYSKETVNKMNALTMEIKDFDKRLKAIEKLYSIKNYNSKNEEINIIDEVDNSLPLDTKDKFDQFEVKLEGDRFMIQVNLPFDINNRYKFTLIYTIYISIGMAIPFLAVRHQLLK